MKLIEKVPKNSCSFLSALDLLKKSRWIETIKLNNDESKYHNLLEVLADKGERSYEKAIK